MKKRMLLIVMALLLAVSVVVTGCAPGAPPGTAPGAPLAGTLRIGGSTTVHVTIAPMIGNFTARHPNITVEMHSVGSTAGILGVNATTFDIGMSSRSLRGAELAWNLTQFVAYKDALAPIVHPTNNITNLNMTQLKGIFTGTITNWAEVGGATLPITVIIREEGSGARAAWEAVVHPGVAPAPTVIMIGTLGVRAGVAGDPAAISYVTPVAVDASVRALRVGGVVANATSVRAGTYPITRPGLFLTRGAPSPLARAFLDWLLGPEGQGLLEAAGMVRVN